MPSVNLVFAIRYQIGVKVLDSFFHFTPLEKVDFIDLFHDAGDFGESDDDVLAIRNGFFE